MITRCEPKSKSRPVLLASRTLPVLLMALAASGCAGPSQSPAASDPAAIAAGAAGPRQAFINGTVDSAEAPFDDSPWWHRFGDPALDQLVAAALAGNLDVRVALARVDEARAGVSAAGARLLPSLSAVGSAAAQNTGYDPAIRQRLPDTDVRRAGFDVSWEIDLFGAARAARNAARQDLLAAEHARRGAQLAVLSETARQYFTLRGAQARLAIVDALIESEGETLRLTGLRRSAGEASDFDVDRAQAQLASLQASRAPLLTLVEATRYRIGTLTGRPPGHWDALLVPVVPQAQPIAVASGQPADLLSRRPDLMAAEAGLRSAGFSRDEARANRYPRLLLSAMFGTQWTGWNGLALGATPFKNLAATLALPLFAGGRIQAGIDAADARQRQALALYQLSILQALEESESALVALRDEAERTRDLDSAVAARERSLQRARSIYRQGQGDLLLVLDVERGLLSSRLEQASHRTDELLAIVQLYMALGGGWKAAEAVPSTLAQP